MNPTGETLAGLGMDIERYQPVLIIVSAVIGVVAGSAQASCLERRTWQRSS